MTKLHRSGRGFSLVEVVIAGVVVGVVSLAIFSGMIYGVYSQQHTREMNAANRVAAAELERATRTLLSSLTPRTSSALLDNRGTTSPSDDVTATVTLTLHDLAGNTLSAPPAGRPMIEARVTVTWESATRWGGSATPEGGYVLRRYLTP